MTIEQIKETTKIVFQNEKCVYKIDSQENLAVFTKGNKNEEGLICNGKLYYESGLKVLEVTEKNWAIEEGISSDIFDEAIYQKLITEEEATQILETLKTT